jgi:hypothetical protein
MFMMNRMTENV